MTGNRAFLLIGLVAALIIAGLASYFASSSPDGLEFTAEDTGFLDSARDSAAAGSPLADYGVSGVDNEWLSVGLSGIIGVLIVLILATLLTSFLKRGRTNGDTDPADNTDHRATIQTSTDA